MARGLTHIFLISLLANSDSSCKSANVGLESSAACQPLGLQRQVSASQRSFMGEICCHHGPGLKTPSFHSKSHQIRSDKPHGNDSRTGRKVLCLSISRMIGPISPLWSLQQRCVMKDHPSPPKPTVKQYRPSDRARLVPPFHPRPLSEDLITILKRHREWVTTNRQSGERADLSDRDLHGMDFNARQW